jgi:hypothetical protein
MARKFVSPGVFTQEIDQSFLAQGVANIGAGVIGLTSKGAAFAPVTVSDFNDFVANFGDVDPVKMAPYAAKNYLKNSSTMQMVRVLGSRDGKTVAGGNGADMYAEAIIDSTGTVLAIVAIASGAVLNWTGSATGTLFQFSGAMGLWPASSGALSFIGNNTNYIGKVFNTDPTQISTYGHFLYKNFDFAGSGSGYPYATVDLSGTGSSNAIFDTDYTSPTSPWVRSQAFGGNYYNLFQLWTMGDGEASNTDIKVSIDNIRASPFPTITQYGTFDVIVRIYSDTDKRLNLVESYSNVTLDPASEQYLPRVIGDQYVVWNSTTRKLNVVGTYKNRSKYIGVTMGPAGAPPTALPWGHSGYPDLMAATGSSKLADVPYVQNNLDSQGNLFNGTYWGIDVTQAGVSDRLKFTLASGTGYARTSTGAALDLGYLSSSSSNGTTWQVYNTASSGFAPTTGSQRGFTVAFYGGFDGWDPKQADPLAAAGNAGTVATIALKLAVDTLSNPDEIDLNLLAIPGVSSSIVTTYARQMCNDRADCMMIMDIGGGSVSDAISFINNAGVDDNYAASYYPHLRYADTTNGVLVDVPPSVAVLGAFAYSDRVGQVFFAPAGLNRGGLQSFGIVDTTDRLTFQDRNDLYENRINPIATFPNEGIVVFGQKTLQYRPSALDRVNVRRLLIYAKKVIASAAKYLVFEPNNAATWQKFINTTNPILEKVRQDQGIERFKVVMDSTVNTPDLIDRNIMTGKIFLQPTRTAEYIDLSFIITASGVSFEE